MTQSQLAQTPPAPSAELEALAAGLHTEAMRFAERALRARTVGCVDAAAAGLLGSAAVRNARLATPTLSRESVRHLQTTFRGDLAEVFRVARTWQHAVARPYGYPGDFMYLESVYDHAAHVSSETPIGRILDVWSNNRRLPVAVDARKNTLRFWLEDRARAAIGRQLRVLSIASGSARELRELQPELLARLNVTVVDLDPRALAFAHNAFEARPYKSAVHTVVGDVIKGGDAMTALSEEAPFDVIYSFGLFDYLDDRTLLTVAKRCLPLLAPDGRFVFCLKDARHYDAWLYDWFWDWRWIPRTLEDGPRLAGELGLRIQETSVIDEGVIGIYVCADAG